MLKRFLKLFKGSPDTEEGTTIEVRSYLDSILDEVLPKVLVELDHCPAHDPLQLVIVEILRTTMQGVWSDELRRPLVDPNVHDTPVTPAAPPPPPGSPGEVDSSAEELEIIAEAADEESSAELEIVEGLAVQDEVGETNELENLSALIDEVDKEEGSDDGKPRVDDNEVLQAGRVFLAMLIENDRLPTELQLSREESDLARDLLLGYFVGSNDFEDKARTLLEKIEKKFSKGYFSQARILLQLFQTDRNTRVNNDRNIFYEDMILRLGIRRKHSLAAELHEEVEARLKACIEDVNTCAEHFSWLAEHLFIKMHVFARHPDEVVRWRESSALSTRPGASEQLLRYLPPRRWRSLDQFGGHPVSALMREHITRETARRYVANQVKACYFVLRAVGDTGLEGFLDTFFDWSTKTFDFNGTAVLPEIYRRVMSDDDPVASIFNEIYERHYREPAEALLDSLSDSDVEDALRATLKQLTESNFDEIAPGNYDFGGMVFDQIFRIRYPAREFAFKLHRLT